MSETRVELQKIRQLLTEIEKGLRECRTILRVGKDVMEGGETSE